MEPSNSPDPVIRPAAPDDVPAILGLIRELADYERLTDQLELDAERLAADLFGPTPRCRVLVAGRAGGLVAYALAFDSYSSFKTRRCLHLEDLYVTPAARGSGLGKALLRAVAAIARDAGCARLQWCVLDWNADAIGFYESLGAAVLPDWRTCLVEGPAIATLAGG